MLNSVTSSKCRVFRSNIFGSLVLIFAALSGCSLQGEDLLYAGDIDEINLEYNSRKIGEYNSIYLRPIGVEPGLGFRSDSLIGLNQLLYESLDSHTTLTLSTGEGSKDVQSEDISGIFQLSISNVSGQTTSFKDDDRFFFNLSLLDARTGELVWKASYRGNNKPISQNILRLSSGRVIFFSVEELAERGFRLVSEKFEAQRNAHFLFKQK